jgi:hypothetical protein
MKTSRKHSNVFDYDVRLRAAASILLIIFLNISLCSCSYASDLFSSVKARLIGGEPVKTAPIDPTNFARLLVSCLSDSEQIQTVYSSIPSAQLDNLSLSTFEKYIGLLSRLDDDLGPLISFKIMGDADLEVLRDSIIQKLPGQEALIQKTVPVLLEFENAPDEKAVLIFFQQKEDGTAYLSEEWVTQCLELYDFSELYFNSIQAQNVDAVYSLIAESFVGRDYTFSQQTILLKVEEMCRYYLLRVMPEFEEYRVRSIDISGILFEQPNVLDENFKEYDSREVGVLRNVSDGIVVSDVMSNSLAVRDYYLYFGDSRTIRIGDRANSANFVTLFGEPVLTTIGIEAGTVSDDKGELQTERMITVDYPDATITVRGLVDENGGWDGIVTRIRIRSEESQFAVGNVIHPGMTREAFMEIYPFADQTDYILSAETDGQLYELEVRFNPGNGDVVMDIRLQMVEVT